MTQTIITVLAVLLAASALVRRPAPRPVRIRINERRDRRPRS